MAVKYCDHGAYTPTYAKFTVGSVVSGATLTITGMLEGTVVTGQRITWPSQPAGTEIYILAGGTSTGGTGTINLSTSVTVTAGTVIEAMGTGTLRNSIKPITWGVPVDGDGNAQSPSTSAAIASVDFSTLTIPSSGVVLSIMGCNPLTISTGANSATNIQWSSTLSTLLANIGTVLNTLATAVAVDIPTNWIPHQIRNIVSARVVGTTLELMTVCGSSEYNGRVAISIANISPGNVTAYWSGGVSGCWGLVVAQHNAGPSGNLDYRTAGVGVLQPGGVFAGSIDPGDIVHIRANKDVYIGGSGTGQNILAPRVTATIENPPIFNIDDGTVWNDLVVNPKLRIYNEVTGLIAFRGSATSVYVINGKRYNDNEYSLVIARRVGASYAEFVIDTQGSVVVNGTEFVDSSSSVNLLRFSPVFTGTYHSTARVFSTCKFKFNGYYSLFRQSGNSSSGYTLQLLDSIIEHYNVALPMGAVIATGNTTTSPVQNIILDNVRFIGFQSGSRLVGISADERAPQFVVSARNCEFDNVVLRGPILAQSISYYGPNFKLITGYSQYGGRDFFIDSGLGCIEWNSARAFPTLNGKIYGSNAPWSIRLTPTTFTGRLSVHHFLETPKFSKFNTLPSGTRTLRVELLMHTEFTLSVNDLTISVDYLDSAGILRTVNSYLNSSTVLGDSTASWTNSKPDGTVFFVDESTEQLYYKKYLSIVLPDVLGTESPASPNTEVSVSVRLHKSSTAIVQGLFIDPDFTLV